MTTEFKAQVTKDSLVFSAAHFITFNGNICERLHGHNWRVDVCVAGELDENSYVFDFIALRDNCMALVQQLDHKVLLPSCHPRILVTTADNGKEVTAEFEERRWVFPAEDCEIMPITNTTAELIADWFGRELITRLDLKAAPRLESLTIGIEENFGQWATAILPLIPSAESRDS